MGLFSTGVDMNILAIGAHFDDLEIGMGGTIAKHVANGDTVTGFVVTHSEYTDLDGDVRRDRSTARDEGVRSAGILGYDLVCGTHETKEIVCSHLLVQEIEELIVSRNIDCVYTHWDKDVHQDHRAVAISSITAARKVPRLLMYQSNLYINTSAFDDRFVVDISDYFDQKLNAILAHATEVAKFGEGWLDFWINQARNTGQRYGVQYAESFKVVKYLK